MPTRYPRANLNPNDECVLAMKRAFKRAGGFRALAKKLGITPQATNAWKVIPIGRCPAVERITKIPVYELRPDLFKESAVRRSA